MRTDHARHFCVGNGHGHGDGQNWPDHLAGAGNDVSGFRGIGAARLRALDCGKCTDLDGIPHRDGGESAVCYFCRGDRPPLWTFALVPAGLAWLFQCRHHDGTFSAALPGGECDKYTRKSWLL